MNDATHDVAGDAGEDLPEPNDDAIGAMLAAALTEGPVGQFMGTLAVALAAVNVFGGFLVTQRMLEMFKKKEPKAQAKKEEA